MHTYTFAPSNSYIPACQLRSWWPCHQPTSECSLLHLQAHITHRNSLLQNAPCFIFNHTGHTETAYFRMLHASSSIIQDTQKQPTLECSMLHLRSPTSECSVLHLQSHMTHRNSLLQNALCSICNHTWHTETAHFSMFFCFICNQTWLTLYQNQVSQPTIKPLPDPGQDQSTMAQQTEMTVNKHSWGSCLWACFPGAICTGQEYKTLEKKATPRVAVLGVYALSIFHAQTPSSLGASTQTA